MQRHSLHQPWQLVPSRVVEEAETILGTDSLDILTKKYFFVKMSNFNL